MREYGSAPDVTIYGEPGMQFAYVPSHLHHMVFELVKNSLRAVEDRFQESEAASPPIRLVIAEGGEDVTIKVRVMGGDVVVDGVWWMVGCGMYCICVCVAVVRVYVVGLYPTIHRYHLTHPTHSPYIPHTLYHTHSALCTCPPVYT